MSQHVQVALALRDMQLGLVAMKSLLGSLLDEAKSVRPSQHPKISQHIASISDWREALTTYIKQWNAIHDQGDTLGAAAETSAWLAPRILGDVRFVSEEWEWSSRWREGQATWTELWKASQLFTRLTNCEPVKIHAALKLYHT